MYYKNKKDNHDRPENKSPKIGPIAIDPIADTVGLSLPGRTIPDGGIYTPNTQFPVTDPIQQGIPGGKTYLNVKNPDTDHSLQEKNNLY